MKSRCFIGSTLTTLGLCLLLSVVNADVGSVMTKSTQMQRSAKLSSSAPTSVPLNPQAAITDARASLALGDWDDAITHNEQILMFSATDSTITRESVQNLQKAYAGKLKTLYFPTVLQDKFENMQTDTGVANGWSLYRYPEPCEGCTITPHLIHDASLLANPTFGGIDYKTRIPLGWKGWGTGFKRLDDDPESNDGYWAGIHIPGPYAGIWQRVSGLIPGKTYKFLCWVPSGNARIGVDLSGGGDPGSSNVKWESNPLPIEDPKRSRCLLIKTKATTEVASLFLSAVDDKGAVVSAPSVDSYNTEIGEYVPRFIQELDGTAVTGTGTLRQDISSVAGIYKQFSAGSGTGLLAKVRGYLNSPQGRLPDSFFRVGIDPFGGNDPASKNIRWSDKCWNCGEGRRWTDIFVSARKQSSTATLFIEYQIRRKGFDGNRFMSLLLSNASMTSTDEPAVVSELVNGISKCFEDCYFAFAVQALLSDEGFLAGSSVENSKWSVFWRAEALRLANFQDKASKLLAACTENDIPAGAASTFALAKCLADYQRPDASELTKHNAYQRMKEAIISSVNDAIIPQVRLALANTEVNDGHPGKALRYLEPLTNEQLTPEEQMRKLRISAEHMRNGGSMTE